MGTVFKKIVTKPLPAGAEIFTRKGLRLARWRDAKGKTRSERVTTGKDGTERITIESSTYYAKYRDGGRIVRVVPTGCKDETAARSVLADLERRAELVKAGVMTADEDVIASHQAIPLSIHFDTFQHSLRAKGVTRIHLEDTRRYLDRLAAECNFALLGDLNRDSLDKWLAQQQSKPADESLSARSRNAYHGAMVAFCNWCVETKRLAANPFKGIPKANEKADRRRQRRSMSEGELLKLLDVARRRPLLEAQTVRRGKRKGEAYAKLRPETIATLEWTGRERALIYKALVPTGLRKNELASLTVGQLDLDGRLPCLVLNAADEKNREGGDLVIRDDLAADLQAWLADKLARMQADALAKEMPVPVRLPAETPLFNLPMGLLRILDRDLATAGIPKKDERGRTLDVHALRTTFGTLLSKGGVAPRTAQAAMRHSDIRLTMQTYTDPKLLDVRGALAALPDLPLEGSRLETVKATGTNGQMATRVCTPVCTNLVQTEYTADNCCQSAGRNPYDGEEKRVAVTSSRVKENGPLTIAVNGPLKSGRQDGY